MNAELAADSQLVYLIAGTTWGVSCGGPSTAASFTLHHYAPGAGRS